MNKTIAKTITGAVQQGMSKAIADKKPKNKKFKINKTKKKPKKARKPFLKINKQLHAMVCGTLDPFCKDAYGAKLPGTSGLMTIPLSSRTTFNMTTTTTRAISYIFYPDWNYGYGTSLEDVTTKVTIMPALTRFNYNGSVADVYCQQGRVVSAGFVIRNTSPANTIEGSVYIIPLNKFLTGDTFTNAPSIQDPRCKLVNATKDMELAVTAFARGDGALDLEDMLNGTGVQPNRQCFLCYFPNTSVVQTYQIEMFVHMEGILVNTQESLMSLVATGPTKIPLVVNALGDRVRGNDSGIVAKVGGGAVEALSANIYKKAAQAVAGAAGTFFGGPEFGALAYEGAGMIM